MKLLEIEGRCSFNSHIKQLTWKNNLRTFSESLKVLKIYFSAENKAELSEMSQFFLSNLKKTFSEHSRNPKNLLVGGKQSWAVWNVSILRTLSESLKVSKKFQVQLSRKAEREGDSPPRDPFWKIVICKELTLLKRFFQKNFGFSHSSAFFPQRCYFFNTF